MHWSADVYHAPEFTYSNVHLLLKTSHLWILSGGLCRSSVVPFSLHKDQDQTNVHFLSAEGKSISSLNLNTVKNTQGKDKFFRLGLSDKKESSSPDYSEFHRIAYTGRSNLLFPSILHKNSDLFLLAKRRRNRFIIPFQWIQERETEMEIMPCSNISIEIPINGIFRRNSILAYFDDPQYRRKSS